MYLKTASPLVVIWAAIAAALALAISSCASPQVAPRFTQPSTVGIGKGIAEARKHVVKAKKEATDIEKAIEKLVPAKDFPTLKLQITELFIDLDIALGQLDTSMKARTSLDAQLKTQVEQYNKLADSYDFAIKELRKDQAIIKQVNSHWGLGAFGYGLTVLVHHLVILAVCIIAFLALVWVLGLVFPLFGAGVKVASLFIVSAINRIRNR